MPVIFFIIQNSENSTLDKEYSIAEENVHLNVILID